jgi:predicted amidohydrolase YtcJ
VTHRYTILTGGHVLPGAGEPAVTAIAWAGDTVIGLGGDDDMRGLSRGDSRFIDLAGAWVVPLGEGDALRPTEGRLELGGRADLAVVARDPRAPSDPVALDDPAVALVRAGRVVGGVLPGDIGEEPGDDEHEQEWDPVDADASPVRHD